MALNVATSASPHACSTNDEKTAYLVPTWLAVPFPTNAAEEVTCDANCGWLGEKCLETSPVPTGLLPSP